ncbi:MAG: hypothetical protein ACYC96_02635 [Fimbriimonadaceae bacterium]
MAIRAISGALPLAHAPARLPAPGGTEAGFRAQTVFDNHGEALPAFFEFGKN